MLIIILILKIYSTKMIENVKIMIKLGYQNNKISNRMFNIKYQIIVKIMSKIGNKISMNQGQYKKIISKNK